MTSRWTIHHGDVLDVLASMPDCSMDGALSDVPYGLGSRQPTVEELIAYLQGADLDTGGDFMGNSWSVPSVRVWRELFRVLKPGAHALSFAGSRTGDLISIGMRAAGFEIRDTLQWIYAEGMPKSLDVSKAIDKRVGGSGDPARECAITAPATDDAKHWDGFGTALKPAYEPIILARKPLDGSLVDNARKWGVGALAIDACRIEYLAKQYLGRWPANVCLDEIAAEMLDAQSGDRPGMSGGGKHRADYGGGMFGALDSTHTARNDHGGASRFLYVAKASREERDLGCDHLPLRTAGETVKRKEGSAGIQSGRAGAGRTSGGRNYGPCVKPVALTRWLATLIMPPPRRDGAPRRIVVPYAGTGSEMIGAILAGWDDVIGIEREPRPGIENAPDYLSILKARVHLAATNPRAFAPEARRKTEKPDERQIDLFGRRTG